MNGMKYQLKPEDIEFYEKNGAVLLRQVFNEYWIELVTRGIERNMANPSPFSEFLYGPDKATGAYFDDYCNWRKIPEFKDYVNYSPAADIALELMKSEVCTFYHEHVLVKEKMTTKETPWHHDQSYYPIDGNKVCSIWMPVDPVPEDTCVKFVAGSHLWNKWFIPRTFATAENYESTRNTKGRVYETVPEINEETHQILKWTLEPGDCIVFHMKTVHAAPGNLSQTNLRRVLSTRWLGDDAIIAERPWNPSPPILGGLEFGDRVISQEFPVIKKRQ